MRRNIADWRAVRARPIAYRIASNFPIASDCIAITFNALTEAGKFNRFSVSSGRDACRAWRVLRSNKTHPFISRCEMNHGVIADITLSDLAIISRQVI
ncbi:hypothetical protein [Burkholderia stabilis]|uniref:hypothetical protein n=1 Tax=Burkholderia stabilis TaxID=95485 RepID=UPI0015907A43|nr:hypothetical protein [Burkholderia stabilis]